MTHTLDPSLEAISIDQNASSPFEKTANQTAVYWSQEDIMSGKLIYMPTGRIARLHRVEPDGRLVMITPRGQLLCEHGVLKTSVPTDPSITSLFPVFMPVHAPVEHLNVRSESQR